MFAGLMRLESSAISQHHCEVMEGGKASATAGGSGRKRLHRRPGYMRVELPSNAPGEMGEGDRTSSGMKNVDITEPTNTLTREHHRPHTAGASLMDKQQQRAPHKHSSLSLQSFLSSLPSHLVESCTSVPSSAKPQGGDLRLSQGGSTRLTPPGDTNFSSRFSFIQQSLNSSQRTETAATHESVPQAEPVDQSSPKHLTTAKPVSISSSSLRTELFSCDNLSTKASSQSTAASSSLRPPLAKLLIPNQSEPTSAAPAPASQLVESEELSFGEKFWQDQGQWNGRDVTSDLPDCDSCSLDTEVTSSLSVDSDTASTSGYDSATPASASSVTSGYDSANPASATSGYDCATPASITSGYDSAIPASATSGYDIATPASSDQGWDRVVKKYEVILQDSLQNNRTNAKIESMMLRLQRLQQKAILDDDYDTAERFGKKLDELCRERGALNLGLPSRQPSVALFLERLRKAVHSALQRTNYNQPREGSEPAAVEQSDSAQAPQHRRERLVQEKHLVEAEIAELQRRLSELQQRSQSLEQQIQTEETEELEVSVLRSCSAPQLQDMSRALQDLITSQHRTQISVTPSPSMLRLQDQEQALNLSIKEATAKVVMSQRLSGSLRRKVSETETQLLALHEAKLAAISGNDFGSAKELRAEVKAVCAERDRLEGLARRLHALSSGNGQELSRRKETHRLLKQELGQRGAQHESRLKENATKYIELLEDRLHSCGCPALERVWEADLEACHLFLRGLQLHSGVDVDALLPNATAAAAPVACSQKSQLSACTKEEEDCAMLTALGGRWTPEANLQNSEFTKKLEEFLFCMEENHPEDEVSDALGALDLTEHCELISDRLIILEDELQTAMLNRDQDRTASLEKEVREVKATLQTMLAHLRVGGEESEEDVDEVQDVDLMEDGTEEDLEEDEEDEEEEEDQYFSDSWNI